MSRYENPVRSAAVLHRPPRRRIDGDLKRYKDFLFIHEFHAGRFVLRPLNFLGDWTLLVHFDFSLVQRSFTINQC